MKKMSGAVKFFWAKSRGKIAIEEIVRAVASKRVWAKSFNY